MGNPVNNLATSIEKLTRYQDDHTGMQSSENGEYLRRDDVIAALAAAPAVGGEAVAWRVRLAGGNYQITSYSDTAYMWRDGGANVEPLYAAPPASPLRGRDSK